jgi:large subunit ribosomal protein L24
MKQEFSTKWNASKQPRKQRKYLYNLPLHLKQKLFGATLDKVLRKKLGIRNTEVKKGDEAKIMRGKLKGKMGKVDGIDRRKLRVSIEGLNVTKKDGNKVKVWFHPSNLKLIKVDEEDKKRFKRIKKQEEKNAQENK